MAMSKKEKIAEKQLNEYGYEYARTPAEDEQRRQELKAHIMSLYFELFDRKYNYEMCVVTALKEVLDKYDAEKGPITNYARMLLSGRRGDAYRYNKRHSPDMFSDNRLENPIGDDADGGMTLEETLPADESTFVEDPVLDNIGTNDLMGKIIQLVTHLEGRANNPERRNWFRLFFTEGVTCSIKKEGQTFSQEREIFETIKQPYLDFYMSDVCRTQKKLYQTPLRMYGEIVPGQDCSKEPPLPFHADISLAYLEQCEGKKVGNSTRSNQYIPYKQLIEKLKTREE